MAPPNPVQPCFLMQDSYILLSQKCFVQRLANALASLQTVGLSEYRVACVRGGKKQTQLSVAILRTSGAQSMAESHSYPLAVGQDLGALTQNK